MATQTRGRRERRDTEMGLCNCVAAVFQVLVALQSITFISGQGHLNPNAGFRTRKTFEDVSLFPKQQPYGVTSETQNLKQNLVSQINSQIGVIRFEPPFLDFDTECVGMPKLRTVYIHNPHKEYDLQLSSISARTSHFHASFFDKKIVPPGGNTSFEVVFLARVVGNVENTLFINTVYGAHAYQVFGIGIPNPYRLRPYLGAKVPLNSTFSPLISMHNPTSETLQVTEMYSSSGYLQLQLPQGQHEADKEQWAIPPYETREVIRARFMGQVEANHTAFIRIKTEQTEDSGSDFHILPVEVEVSSAPGIYSALELLDFGILRTRYDEPKSLPLFLLNSGNHEVQMSSISLAVPNPAVDISFSKAKLRPSQSMFTLVANVTFSAYLARSEADQKGIIIVKAKEKSYRTLEIPFFVNLLEGTLGYDQQGVLFHFNTTKTSKEVKLSNLFKFPVVLQNLTLPAKAKKVFKVLNFSGPVTLPVSLQTSPFSIEYNPGKQLATKLSEDATEEEPGSMYHLTLHTNASKFILPLYIFSGKISYKVLREDKRKIDFGIMGTNDERQVLFALYNHNPTKILLEKIDSTLKNIQIRLVSLTEEDSGKNLTYDDDIQLEHFWLPTNSCSVFEVTLTATDIEEDIVDSIKILSEHQEIIIPVLAKIIIGTLTVKPEKIKFAKSFPGRVVHQTLTVINTFAQSTKLEYVHAEQVDKRFYYKKLKNQGLKLEPNKQAKIGKVYFDARLGCKPDRCYTGLPTSTTVGHHWLTTLALGADSVEFDTKRYNEHRRRWWNVQNKGLTGPNTTLVLSADVVMNVKVPVQASLYWPSLLKEESFDFPLTHVGRKSTGTLRLHNPADSPVIVQVLPLSLYPQPEAALHTLGWEDKLDGGESFIVNNSSVFNLLDPRRDSIKDSMSAQMVWLEYTLNGKLNHSVVNLFLEAGDKIDLNVEFIPYDDSPKSTVLLLRNNLTILDAIPLYGRGAYEHLTLGGRAPNLKSSVLRFKLNKELLKDCTRKKTNPSFTVRKWFHANNTGDLPIHITSMTVSGSPCEGYGFRVLDCDQFILQPNTSKKIEIAYTPDFTSYLVLHKLRLVTSQGNEMLFTLNVTLPPHMLPLCQEAVPRPSWEPTLYHFIASVILVLAIGVLLMGYLESVTIWDSFIRVHYDDLQQKLSAKSANHASPPGFEKPFDLRDIGNNYSSASAIGAGDEDFTVDHKKSSPIGTDPSINHTSDFLDDMKRHPTKSSSKSKGILCRLFSYFRRAHKTQTVQSPLSDDVVPVDNSTSATHNEVPTLNVSNGPRLRNTAINVDKRKNDKKIRSLNHSNCNDRYSKPTAEIRPVSKISDASKRKNFMNDSLDKFDSKLECLTPKRKDNSVERHSESDEFVSHNVVKTKAVERRRSHSKSSQRSRESTSSSESLYSPEPVVLEQQCDCHTPAIQYQCSEMEESKSTRTRKLKKPSRKQLKALAREKESQNKENELKVPPEKPCIANFGTDTLKNCKKNSRQPKHRSDSSESIERRFPASAPKPSKKSFVSDHQPPRLQSSRNKENKIVPKRRSYSYSADTPSRPKEKSGKVTICKRPSPPSSSSHEISESSSSESSALWDTPCNARDADEDMRQISKQSQQAELMIGVNQRKDRKRGKGTSSPANLTSGSRSSSYSSIKSSGSNDSNSSKPVGLGASHRASPTKKLSRSQSDTSGGTPATSLLRKRNPRPAVDSSTNSPTRSLRLDVRNTSPPLQQNQYNRPTRALSSPSMFVNSFGGRTDSVGQDERDVQWTSPNQIVASSYSAFGDSAFNLVGDLISNRRHNTSLTTTWESPFPGNSSLYSTPTPPRTQNRSPPDFGISYPQQWNSARAPVQQNNGYPQYDAPPGTPTTPGVLSQPPNWGDVAASTGNNMTTHGIWSVSNAVTMDENRSTDESDPLGVKSIWSNTPNMQSWGSPR